jgi:ribosomal protein S18 acetylase RimI-like enzyme
LPVQKILFQEYAQWLGRDLSFQGFATELAGLPGAYAPPDGRLFLALTDEKAAGCVALRPQDGGFCEMKRLFVRPAFRRQGVGRLLAQRVIASARECGYSEMRLDTLPFMEGALLLYEALGFVRCPAYYETRLRETVFMKLQLYPTSAV